jgi:hypothetical protein
MIICCSQRLSCPVYPTPKLPPYEGQTSQQVKEQPRTQVLDYDLSPRGDKGTISQLNCIVVVDEDITEKQTVNHSQPNQEKSTNSELTKAIW